MASVTAKTSARESILVAAESVVHERGAGNLTLDAVARRASVSKGGLLYHFPSKEALLKGMVRRQLDQFESEQAALRRGPTPDSGAELAAFMRASFEDSEESRRFCAAMLAAVANKPELLQPVRDFHQRHLRKFTEGKDASEGAIILWLATSGLWFLELLQVSPLTKRERRRVTSRLLKLAGKEFGR